MSPSTGAGGECRHFLYATAPGGMTQAVSELQSPTRPDSSRSQPRALGGIMALRRGTLPRTASARLVDGWIVSLGRGCGGGVGKRTSPSTYHSITCGEKVRFPCSEPDRNEPPGPGGPRPKLAFGCKALRTDRESPLQELLRPRPHQRAFHGQLAQPRQVRRLDQRLDATIRQRVIRGQVQDAQPL